MSIKYRLLTPVIVISLSAPSGLGLANAIVSGLVVAMKADEFPFRTPLHPHRSSIHSERPERGANVQRWIESRGAPQGCGHHFYQCVDQAIEPGAPAVGEPVDGCLINGASQRAQHQPQGAVPGVKA